MQSPIQNGLSITVVNVDSYNITMLFVSVGSSSLNGEDFYLKDEVGIRGDCEQLSRTIYTVQCYAHHTA